MVGQLLGPGDFGRYRTRLESIDARHLLMQTLCLILLLVAALLAAFFDARELFLDWYSMTDPQLTTRQRNVIVAELTLCTLLILLTAARLTARV